ncbi:MAG: hypothetical protein R2873_16715 [Caldilineaceae bacterium]
MSASDGVSYSAGAQSADAAAVSAGTVTFSGVVTTSQVLTIETKVAKSVAPGSMITNTATVTAPGVFAGTHTDVAVLEVAELGAFGTSTLSAPAQATTDSSVTYRLVVTNTGQTLSTAVVTAPVLTSMTFGSAVVTPETTGFGYNSKRQPSPVDGPDRAGDSRTFVWSASGRHKRFVWRRAEGKRRHRRRWQAGSAFGRDDGGAPYTQWLPWVP